MTQTPPSPSPQTGIPLRIITYNIRYAATDLSAGEQPWAIRAPRIIAQLRFASTGPGPCLISLQEVLKPQLDDLLAGLNRSASAPASPPEWACIGVGRDDGRERGEYGPVFYRPAVWHLRACTTRWLSPTPDVPSRGWDAACPRILTVGDFVHRATGRRLVAMNTHLDHVGSVAREHSARMIVEEVRRYVDCSAAVFLTGDLNSMPEQEAYRYLTREESPVFDVRTAVAGDQRYGHRRGTFTDFDGRSDQLLDYIFLDKSGGWTPEMYAVLENVFDEGIYYSDHRAVVADMRLTLPDRPSSG